MALTLTQDDDHTQFLVCLIQIDQCLIIRPCDVKYHKLRLI